MKKVALSLLALAVVGVSAFADAPKWDPKVSTGLKGEATATLGYDLDTGLSALSNGTSVSLFVDLISKGDAVTSSDKDVWGEIRVYVDGDPLQYKADGVTSGTKLDPATNNNFQLKVDYAKIHFGKAAYLSVTGHDTNLGYAASPDMAFTGHLYSHNYTTTAGAAAKSEVVVGTGSETAVAGVTYTTLAGAAQALPLTAGTPYIKNTAAGTATTVGTRYGTAAANVYFQDAWAFGADPKFAAQGPANGGGIEFGYSLDKVASVTVDLASTDTWGTKFVDAGAKTNIAYRGILGLLAVDNLAAEVAYGSTTIADSSSVIGGKVAYTYKINGDKLYVKPQAGVTYTNDAGATSKKYITATGGVLLGTGAKAATFDNYSLKVDNDFGGYPGVALGFFYTDKAKVVSNADKANLGLNLSVNSGEVVKDLTFVGAYEIKDLNATDVTSLVTVGAAYAVTAGDIKFAPKGMLSLYTSKAGVSYYKNNVLATADSSAFAKFTMDVTGIAPFVTLTTNYESNDLVNGYGVKNDKLGKFEFTTKVNF